MKKFHFAILFVLGLLASNQSFAQYAKGDKLLNVGVGLSSYYGGGVPLGASFEVGVTDDISVGGQIDYNSWSYGYNYGPGYNFSYRYTFIPIAVRGSYHLNKVLTLNNEKVDLYAGAALGYWVSSYKFTDNTGTTYPSGYVYNNDYGNKVLFGIYAGARYYFKPSLGAFAELGYGVSALKIGVSFKF